MTFIGRTEELPQLRQSKNLAGLDLIIFTDIRGIGRSSLDLSDVTMFISQDVGRATWVREVVKSAGTYFQNATSKTSPVQIDLLIECKPNNFYICEVKYKRRISISVVDEVQEKIKKLKLPKYSTRRPVLIYSGELDPEVIEADYFDKIVEIG